MSHRADSIEAGTPPPAPKAESNPGKSIAKGYEKFASHTSTNARKSNQGKMGKQTGSGKQSRGKARTGQEQSQEADIMSQCTVKDRFGRVIPMEPCPPEVAEEARRKADNDQSQNICDSPPNPTINRNGTQAAIAEGHLGYILETKPRIEPAVPDVTNNASVDKEVLYDTNGDMEGLHDTDFATSPELSPAPHRETDPAVSNDANHANVDMEGIQDTDFATSPELSPAPHREVDPDTYMINNADDCQTGLPGSKHASAAPREGSTTALPRNQGRAVAEREAEAVDKMFQRAEANPLLGPEGREERVNAFLAQDVEEAKVTAALERGMGKEGARKAPHRKEGSKATKEGIIKHVGGYRGPGTGANATPIRSRDTSGQTRQTTPKQDATNGDGKAGGETHTTETRLVEGKPGKVQRTRMGDRGYWNRGPENTADISPPPSRPTSVQVLITGCPSIPARGDEWKRSFLAGFNARRERLAPETPICATQVAFAVSYPTERVVTIHHPPNMKHEEIIRAVARVRREMYNNYIQHQQKKSLRQVLRKHLKPYCKTRDSDANYSHALHLDAKSFHLYFLTHNLLIILTLRN
ncbi:hypothetical protein L211DRAFT_851215 [Terfezia boudieri ATCC MYA-4762]|uniref:Uncharacterized protein n=1 Tax=Terfezia boudieri ATCC MYA-4762 TaxID=1051890 RepID=A0A3N4LM45_9PEZI|nr:hypothetical protein L211DRAFT_851215 [Terfezia boudieri ATCC MYA-4762]